MKIWIDKKGGYHYHKADCGMLKPIKNKLHLLHLNYEEIEQDMRGLGKKYIEGRWYRPCPFCFGYDKRRK